MAEYKNVENIRNLFDEEFKKTRQLIQQGETHLDNLAEGFLEADRVLLRIPTADVVEVVRCEKCKHSKELAPHSEISPYYRHCSLWRGEETKNVWHKYKKYYADYSIVEPDDYCSYGERKCEE